MVHKCAASPAEQGGLAINPDCHQLKSDERWAARPLPLNDAYEGVKVRLLGRTETYQVDLQMQTSVIPCLKTIADSGWDARLPALSCHPKKTTLLVSNKGLLVQLRTIDV